MENEINTIIKENMLQKIKEHYYLTEGQINVLKTYNVPYKECNDTKELLFLLNQYPYDEQLEEIATEISEFDYYQNTKK